MLPLNPLSDMNNNVLITDVSILFEALIYLHGLLFNLLRLAKNTRKRFQKKAKSCVYK